MNAYSRTIRQVIGHVFVTLAGIEEVNDELNNLYMVQIAKLVFLAQQFDETEQSIMGRIFGITNDKCSSAVNILHGVNPDNLPEMTDKIEVVYSMLGIERQKGMVN